MVQLGHSIESAALGGWQWCDGLDPMPPGIEALVIHSLGALKCVFVPLEYSVSCKGVKESVKNYELGFLIRI